MLCISASRPDYDQPSPNIFILVYVYMPATKASASDGVQLPELSREVTTSYVPAKFHYLP